MQQYKTSDIILASVLKCQGINLIDIEVVGNRGFFIFESVDEEFINDFNLGKLRVEPTQYHNAVKQLTASVRRLTQTKV